ncbi:hypothetical protein LRR81_08060 [Metabacillus sp. GX 13764]|uniref:hypothetical protein n=1 Tax=Metabacillus kandeliae TaxID=2900151 RepID=UPI001E2A5D5A|nr:hypothetical protein [Metabacillus kandeliae]MCD7034185.1 hypothetical protein [Metabacillus kandeliae]
MFLDELQPEEKAAFLELASLIAKVDGKLSIFEHTVFKKYREEMGFEEYQVKGLAIEEILHLFKDERSKNIVLAEILRLIYADGVFQEEEQESIRLIKQHFGFHPNEFKSLKDWVGKIKELSAPE